MTSGFFSPRRHRPALTTNRHGRRRLWRILAFAILFVVTALRRMYQEHTYLEFLTSLLSEDAPGGEAPTSPTTTDKSFELAEDADLVIFYNLYVPHNNTAADEGDAANALFVVQDQMEQISSALRRMEGESAEGKDGEKKGYAGNDGARSGVVFYNLIGDGAALPPARMGALCRRLHPRLECRRLRHRPEGGEAMTLQDAHDFCRGARVGDAPNRSNNGTSAFRRVTYLHSKGSYHPQRENHVWRRIATDAALHPRCLDPPDGTCDVCGAQFYIKYAVMFPGNMWTARCSYLRTLIPPDADGEYARRKEASIRRFLMLRLWGALDATLDTRNVEHFGLGRYAWEHWVASSPHLRPCEVHTTEVGPLILLGKDPKGRKFGPEHYDWGMAPRRIKENLGGLRQPRLRLESNPELQFREYYFLPGNLLKWFFLYGSEGVPTQDSWVWHSFPAGERWKDLVGRYREKAIDVMVANSTRRFHSAFDSEDCGKMVESTVQPFRDEDALLSLPNPPIVVFYQITIPPAGKERAMAAVKSQFDALSQGQYDHDLGTFNQRLQVLLYYTIAGGSTKETDFVSNLCTEKSDRISCQQLGRHDGSEECSGGILQQLHSFCKAKPSHNVIHIANALPGYHLKAVDKTFNAPKLQAMTSAVMSKMCLPSEDSCNVCGTEFYPLPFFHFTGNMFSASCGYINNLLPPSMFEKTMNDIAGSALLAQLKETYTTKLLKFDARILGSYQHSIEHWIGAHPDLKPCDVAPTSAEKFDGTLIDRMMPHSRAPAPRRGSAPPGYLTGDSESQFRLKRSKALREYYYLAGNVFRWDRLYGKVPDANSWVWQWFPDGQLWETAARSLGENAVNQLAKQLRMEEA